MTKESSQYNPKFENEVKSSVVGEKNIIYNYFYYKECIRAKSDTLDETTDENKLPCPYQGLFHFGPDKADIFFGRDLFIEELFQATQTHNFIPVLGASGSGKSSVVLAGLVPKLEEEGNWKFTHFRPGIERQQRRVSIVDPFYSLAKALVPLYTPKLNETKQLAQASELADFLRNGKVLLSDVISEIQANYSNHRILLIADQFEEIYTICKEEELRRHFLDILIDNIYSPINKLQSPFVIMLTMRADFLSNALSYRPFADALQNRDVKLGTMNREELSQVIEQPAKKLGVKFEVGLVERILNDIDKEPGNLPLLEFALTELWTKRTGRQLTHHAYENIGQVQGALADYADKKYSSLTPNKREKAQHIFIQLVRPGEGTEDTRRQANRVELGEENWNLIIEKGGLADSRLVVTSRNDTKQETVEVVHEALIRNWGQLREWMKDNRKFRAWQEQLRISMRQWESLQRDEGALLRGLPLIEAENWQKERLQEVSENEKIFIRTSVSLREKEKREREHRKRNVILGLSCGLLGALLLAVVAGWQWQQAQIGQVEALSTSSKALFSTDPIASLIDSLKATRKLKQTFGANIDIQSKLKLSLLQAVYSIKEQNRFENHRGIVNQVSFGPNGEMIASASGDGTLRLWNIDGKELEVIWEHRSRLLNTSFSPNGKIIASVGEDRFVRLWTLGGQEIITLARHKEPITSLEFSPDGTSIISSGEDGLIKLWNLDGSVIRTIKGHNGKVKSATFSPNGRMIASSGEDGFIKLWNFDGQEIIKIKDNQDALTADSIIFSPDGKSIFSIYEVGDIKIWNIDGSLFGEFSVGDSISCLSFSPDGEVIAIGNNEGFVKILRGWRDMPFAFNIPIPSELSIEFGITSKRLSTYFLTQNSTTLGKHRDRVSSISFSPDGKTIASSSSDSSVKLWNLGGIKPQILKPEEGSTGPVKGISLSPDGKMIIAGDSMRMLRLWNLTSLEPIIIGKHHDFIRSVDFNPNGKTVAIAYQDGTVKLWNLEGQELVTLTEHNSGVNSLKFSPTGEKIALGSDDGTIKLWNPENQKLYVIGVHNEGSIKSLDFSPDGKIIASGSGNGIIKIWNLNGKILETLKGHLGGINDVTFSPDGQVIASGGSDTIIKIWNLNGQEITTLWGHGSSVDSLSFSPDGTMIASSGGTVKLWLLGNPEPIILGGFSSSAEVSFSSDGKKIFSSNGSGFSSIFWWNTELDHLQSQGCKFIRSYLKNNPNVEDRTLCDRLGSSIQSETLEARSA